MFFNRGREEKGVILRYSIHQQSTRDNPRFRRSMPLRAASHKGKDERESMNKQSIKKLKTTSEKNNAVYKKR